jgi:60 kDa SS-A/Ro ribonucleoprotein
MNYASIIKPKPETVPQSAPLDKRQILNDAGGYVYSVGAWGQLDRFLILGAEGGTYYASERKHVTRTYEALKACLKADAPRAIDRIREISVNGLAPKQDPAIFALAVAATWPDESIRHLAQAQVSAVCRPASTFFMFLEQYKALGGKWPRTMRRTAQEWYSTKSLDTVAYQSIKYRNRNGWSHRDVLRLSHLKPTSEFGPLLQWLVKDEWPEDAVKPKMVEGFLKAQESKSAKDAARVITEYGLPREAVPGEFLKEPEVWDALLPSMPMTAMIRNLGNMSACKLLVTGSSAAQLVNERLHDEERLVRARIHPLNVLIALRQYEAGQGLRGSNSWNPVAQVVAAMDDAFYLAFKGVRPTGKRFLVGLDVSGSMGSQCGIGSLRSCEVSAALSMVWAATEPACEVMGFSDKFINLGFTRKMSLQEATKKAVMANFGSTDCSMPMQWAAKKRLEFDVFVVITDNETWSGSIHPKAALNLYRGNFVPDARQVVLGTTATQCSIADPKDPLALDIAGFSSDVPAVINAFVGGPLAAGNADSLGTDEGGIE